MAVLGFPAEVLNEHGGVRWADEISLELGFVLHAFHGLNPEQALNLVGGKVIKHVKPGELPAEALDDYTTVFHVAVSETQEESLLVAGRGSGDWSFVYDLSGLTTFDISELVGLPKSGFRQRMSADLPPGPRPAAQYSCTINGDEHLEFSEGEQDYRFDGYLLNGFDDIRERREKLPPILIPAVEAAGTFEFDDEKHSDSEVGLRIICALAGLTWTIEEFRQQELIIAYF